MPVPTVHVLFFPLSMIAFESWRRSRPARTGARPVVTSCLVRAIPAGRVRNWFDEGMMQGRYPRSVSEFAANQRHVLVYCGECNRKREVVNDVLEAMLGPDFDLYDGYAALT